MFGPRMMKEFFGGGHKRGFGPRRGRVFEKGDLKYLILDLLKDEPSHGYELIRALEERFRGFYSPSPGSVYPTLQLLEDLAAAPAAMVRESWEGLGPRARRRIARDQARAWGPGSALWPQDAGREGGPAQATSGTRGDR